jgi:hypothetical protein
MPSPPREEARERGNERAIGRPQLNAAFLAAEHGQLMAQHEQLEVLAELAAPVSDQQPQHS